MPKFTVEIPHTHAAPDAKARLERFVEMLQSEHGEKVSDLSQSWVGNTLSFGFKTFGIKIAGTIEALDNLLRVTGDLPFTAMMFKGKIESEIKQQLTRLLR